MALYSGALDNLALKTVVPLPGGTTIALNWLLRLPFDFNHAISLNQQVKKELTILAGQLNQTTKWKLDYHYTWGQGRVYLQCKRYLEAFPSITLFRDQSEREITTNQSQERRSYPQAK